MTLFKSECSRYWRIKAGAGGGAAQVRVLLVGMSATLGTDLSHLLLHPFSSTPSPQAGLRDDDDLLLLQGDDGVGGTRSFACCPRPEDLGHLTAFLKEATGIKVSVKRQLSRRV
jgi:hypothetical protein